jgi:hypothetical protein
MRQHLHVAEGESVHRQWAEPAIAALGETRRAAVALAVASRHLAKLTDYFAAAGKDPAEAERLLAKAWASLGGQEPPTPDEMAEFWSNFAPPPPRDVPDDERPGAEIASEAFLALLGAIHCAVHGRAQEAVHVLENGLLAARFADRAQGAAREMALQRRDLDAAASISGVQELVTVLRRQEAC